MAKFVCALLALLAGLLIFFDVSFGSLTPKLVAIAIILLALALLIEPAFGYVRRPRV